LVKEANAQAQRASKGWKDFLLRSGVPLEYDVALMLAREGMSVGADFSYLRRDLTGFKESSIDLTATWYGPGENNVKYELSSIIECKYRSPEKVILLLNNPNIKFPPEILGGTVTIFDEFVPYHFPLNTFEQLERKLDFVYKAIELHDNGAHDDEMRYAIQQLRYATPAYLRSTFDFGITPNLEEAIAVFFSKILVTNAPLRLLSSGVDIKAIRAAKRLEDISTPIDTAILYSDYGPDFEDHARFVFGVEAEERKRRAEQVKHELVARGKEIDFLTDPVDLVEDLRKASRSKYHHIGTQFFVTTLRGLRPLIRSIKQAMRHAYRRRTTRNPLSIRRLTKRSSRQR
jgi:hypothetical protein